MKCERCGRGAPLVQLLTQVRGGMLCEACLEELTVFRSVAVDTLLDAGGHLKLVGPKYVRLSWHERYDREAKQWVWTKT